MDTTGMGTSGGPAAGAGRRAPTAAERLFDAALRWWRQRETEAALMRCSDHVLADIGIARDHIPLVARGLDPAAVPSRGAALQRVWQDLLDRIAGLREAEQRRRAAIAS